MFRWIVLNVLLATALLGGCETIAPDQKLDIADGGGLVGTGTMADPLRLAPPAVPPLTMVAVGNGLAGSGTVNDPLRLAPPALPPLTMVAVGNGLTGSGTVNDPLRLAGPLISPGTVVAFAGRNAPPGWLLCDGRSLDSTDASSLPLFLVIGFAYGGDMKKIFSVPDLRGRLAVGLGTSAEVSHLGDSDGLAVAGRKVKHAHDLGTLAAVAVGDHAHNLLSFMDMSFIAGLGQVGTSFGAQWGYGNPAFHGDQGAAASIATGVTSNNGGHTHSLTGQVGDATGPLNGSAYQVVNYIIKM